MKELSRAEATYTIADRVMGWWATNNGWWAEKGTNHNIIKDDDYNPFADDQLHRCFEALEKWNNTVSNSVEIEYTGRWCVRCYDRFTMVAIKSGCQSLNVAIITALCSAVLGCQATIKEEV